MVMAPKPLTPGDMTGTNYMPIPSKFLKSLSPNKFVALITSVTCLASGGAMYAFISSRKRFVAFSRVLCEDNVEKYHHFY